jgi:hypothetical protein
MSSKDGFSYDVVTYHKKSAARAHPRRTSPEETDDRIVWRTSCRARKESREGTRNRVRDEKQGYKETHTPHAHIPPPTRRAP